MRVENLDIILPVISRILSGDVNKNDKEILEKWISESENNQKYFDELGRIYLVAGRVTDAGRMYTGEALKKVILRTDGPKKKSPFMGSWWKIAASILIPLLIINSVWFAIQRNSKRQMDVAVYNEVFANFGTRTALRLADSSLVWLNSGSSLRYPEKFVNNLREVFLDGEAYFEVHSNRRMPFVVRTSSLSVVATGTSFNVSDYKADTLSEVTLVSGRVSVNRHDNSGKNRLLSKLEPDQHLVFNSKSDSLSISIGDTYKYIAWKDGKIIFRNEPMTEVLKKISRIFNVDFEIRGNALRDYAYRATFVDESLTEILKLLEISSPIGYREVKRTPLPDGTFPKKKVIIFQPGKKL